MEEIEVGEYIRTYSKIRRVTNANFYMLQYVECGEDIVWRNDIVKHSKNIIDLIEVGDYVNGKEVHKYNGNTGIVSINELGWTFIAFKDKKYPIETIVTREQFASMEYKIEA